MGDKPDHFLVNRQIVDRLFNERGPFLLASEIMQLMGIPGNSRRLGDLDEAGILVPENRGDDRTQPPISLTPALT